MHITASWGGAEVEVEVGEECRSLAALKEAVCSALPEGVDGEKVCLEVCGRAVEEEDVLALSEGGRVDAVPTLAVRAADALREEGRAVDEEGFVTAARGGDLRICGLYLDAGVVCPSGQVTPLHMAVSQQNSELCTLLLDRGADMNARNDDGDTPLQNAVYYQDIGLCTLLLDRGADVKDMGNDGGTALHCAVFLENTELCTLLIDRGADVNSAGYDSGTPFHCTVLAESTSLCTLLLERGGAVNTKSDEGDTPLHDAVFRRNSELCTLLLDRGADVHAKNDSGKTPLDLAGGAVLHPLLHPYADQK